MRSEYRLGASNGPQALWETVAFGRQWALVTCSANSDMNFAHVHDAKTRCARVCVCVSNPVSRGTTLYYFSFLSLTNKNEQVAKTCKCKKTVKAKANLTKKDTQ